MKNAKEINLSQWSEMSFLISLRVIIKKWLLSTSYTEFKITIIAKADYQSFQNKKINHFLQPVSLMKWKNDMHTSKKL